MAIISYDMSQVPNEVPPLDADTYTFRVLSAEMETIDNDAQWNAGKDQLTLKLQVEQPDHKNNGRIHFDRFVLDDERDRIKFKAAIKSAGLVPSVSMDTDDLVDKLVKAEIKVRAGKGDNAGRFFANVSKYLF